jgi:hypothetical protein
MKQMKNLYLLILSLILLSCNQKEIQITNLSETEIGGFATKELTHFLGKTFNEVQFKETVSKETADIQLLLSTQAKEMGIESVPIKKESFKIIPKDGKLLLIAPDERGLLNASYALLEKLGYGFYISGDVVPKPKKWSGFDGWEMEDAPLTGNRFLFNWHNFLSGCTGWNLEDWQKWIDQANKMRYNGIMVHAYGNNPMFSFEYLGDKKHTGYLNNTSSGRDWGNQHVNDVRRMVGGEIFNEAVFGAKASFASEENKEKEATELMQQVFQYAEDRGTKVIFALDFDTWMSNPANIIEKLPKEAVFELIGGHLTPNPDHPEGYNYFKQLVKSLVEMYPQIDQLSIWHRRPSETASLGTIWMSFDYKTFPESWKKEYLIKLKEHPEIENDQKALGTFAYGKLIAAVQKARDEIKPALEITSGSWRFDYIPYADAMYPKDVPLLPLDWDVVFDTPEAKEILANAGKNREIYPIIWAHHDDHRYIGRPYTPWENLSELLEERNAKGFGIIHWTTHPLDLYFTSSARQVWESTANEPLKTTVENYVTTNFGSDTEKLSDYFYQWITAGPMFGRETSDHFVDLGRQSLRFKMESWEEMKEKAEKRLKILSGISSVKANTYLQYQEMMEEFYISFFENQNLFQDAYELTQNGEIGKAIDIISNSNPDITIQKYTDACKLIGFTSGEKAIVFSMNTRWKADFINLKQRLGMEPVRMKFSPTQHDPLAQAPGHFTYFIDENKNWWRCLWKNELVNSSFVENNLGSALVVNSKYDFKLTSIHGQSLPQGNYTIRIKVLNKLKPENMKLSLNNTCGHVATSISDFKFENKQIVFNCSIEDCPEMNIVVDNGEIQITSIEFSKLSENTP